MKNSLQGFYVTRLMRATQKIVRSQFLVSDLETFIISPHYDDETFGCGNLIGRKRERDIPVTVIFLTNGQRCFGPNPADPSGLEETRRREAKAALGHLGVPPDSVHFLGLQDGELNTLSGTERVQAVESLADLIRINGPVEVFAPHHSDRHADHEAANSLTREAITAAFPVKEQPILVEYFVWYYWAAPMGAGKLLASDLARAAWLVADPALQERKRKAIAEYRSQKPILPFGFLQQHSRPEELFSAGA
ncbi:MAG: PIG-L family deacetylase [Armatimonadota bacterium]